jgi:signal peptidase II
MGLEGQVAVDAGQPPAPRRFAVLIGMAAIVLAADVGSKATVVGLLSGRRHVRLFGGPLTLLVARNPGAAFGIGGPPLTGACTAIAAGVAVIIVGYSRHIGSTPWAVALGLLLGGAMGNLTDRVFRSPGPLQGWVVDWIRFRDWPAFNIADAAIACGIALLAVLAARGTTLLEAHRAAGDHDNETGPAPVLVPVQPGPPPALRLVLVPVQPGPAPVPEPTGAAGAAGPP